MSALLARFAPRRALGVYAGERQLTVSQVAATPLGPVEIARRTVSYDTDDLPKALEGVLASLPGRWRGSMPAAVGLPPQRLFFSTRPIRTASMDAAPEVLLHEVLQSPSVSVDEMVVDLVKSRPDRRRLASLVACRRKYLTGMLDALAGRPLRLVRAEPAPCALLRVAARRARDPRRARTVVRIFLGEAQGLAVATAARIPVVWRTFPLQPGEEVVGVLSIVRRLQTVLPPCGVESALDAVIVHGRGDLRASLEADSLRQELGLRLTCVEGPALDDAAVAYGLAVGCLDAVPETFDLARTVKPPPRLRELVPWGEAAVVAALVFCMGLFLNVRRESLAGSYAAVRDQNAGQKWLAAVSDGQLVRERQDLGARADAVQWFLATRVVWSACARDVAARLPADAKLTLFDGKSELAAPGLPKGGAAGPQKKLLLNGVAPVVRDRAVPPQIDTFLESLRAHPRLRRDFPAVELSGIQALPATGTTPPVAAFTVVGLPRSDKGPRPAAAGESREARR